MGQRSACISVLELLGAWELGAVLSEVKHRDSISDEQYAKEYETHGQVIARLKERIEAARAA
jgi:hypothetical protein